VAAEIKEQNKLPDAKRHWHQPDVILKNKGAEIEYIVEVENDPVRKTVVGASVLADACLRALKQKKKPQLYFVIYTQEGIKQIPNFREKIKIVKPYCRYLADIKALSVKEFKKLQL
jgi:hypothetical protein